MVQEDSHAPQPNRAPQSYVDVNNNILENVVNGVRKPGPQTMSSDTITGTGGDGNDVTLQLIPESTTFTLLFSAAAGMVMRRRRGQV